MRGPLVTRTQYLFMEDKETGLVHLLHSLWCDGTGDSTSMGASCRLHCCLGWLYSTISEVHGAHTCVCVPPGAEIQMACCRCYLQPVGAKIGTNTAYVHPL